MADRCSFEVMPLATSAVVRNAPVHSLNYTSQDFQSIRDRMFDLARQRFGQDYNDFQESSSGRMLIELMAFLGDQLSFKIDMLANEFGIDTVTEMANMARLAELVGFRPTPPLPAKAMFSVSLSSVMSVDLPVKTPVRIAYMAADGSGERTMELFPADENDNPLYDQDLLFPAGTLSTNHVAGVEGATSRKTFVGTGEPFQRYELAGKSILWRSIRVSVDGTSWTDVEFFTDSLPRPEFRVEYGPNYSAAVVFGNNQTGLVPPKGASIIVAYRSGGGEAGNIVTGAFDKSIPIHVPGIGHLLQLQIKNYTRGEGGYGGDTIDDIRYKLPLYLKTQDRAVTGADYKSLCDMFVSPHNGAVGKSAAVLRAAGCAGNIVDVYVLQRSGRFGLVTAAEGLKAELAQEVGRRKMISDTVCVRDGTVVAVDVNVEVVLDRTHKRNEDAIREKIYRRAGQLFALSEWEFGRTLRDADLVKALADVREVDQIDVSFTTTGSLEQGHGTVQTVTTRFNEIIRPDNINVNFFYKGPGE